LSPGTKKELGLDTILDVKDFDSDSLDVEKLPMS